ncbi:MAG: hypothetical protein HYS87_02980 [Candidatus Colwellbacteria bacterium]|nr:hypothetical protein [Candidatus Colwellbacteria bacterium]
MRQSELFIKTSHKAPSDEETEGAKLLVRGGFINKEAAGIYSYLPLGLRVLENITAIIREEMNSLGANELLMPVLHPKENWQTTGRWETLDILYKVEGHGGKWFALGPTHEEIIAPIAKKQISSYRDLPAYFYQIQTKFRNEPRAKSGILRGREFLMKDLYSFHTDEKDLEKFYAKALNAYKRIFKRLGIKALLTEASGGTFSKYSHEFQALSDIGEDEIFYCKACGFSQNKEIAKIREGACPKCGKGEIQKSNSIEVGNIFKLGTKYSSPFAVKYKTKSGEELEAVMGCYGIGISRIMGTLAEINRDNRGLLWPEKVAPFKLHLIELKKGLATKAYKSLQDKKDNILYDDRDTTAGEKFADSDLLGIPYRAVISQKTKGKIELKQRNSSKTKLVSINNVKKLL